MGDTELVYDMSKPPGSRISREPIDSAARSASVVFAPSNMTGNPSEAVPRLPDEQLLTWAERKREHYIRAAVDAAKEGNASRAMFCLGQLDSLDGTECAIKRVLAE